MAIAMAQASTTKPASCPPISRGLSGSVAETATARTRSALRPVDAAAPELGLALGLGETVGKSPEGSLGEVPRSGSGGSDTGGSVPAAGGAALDVGLAAAMTTAAAEA